MAENGNYEVNGVRVRQSPQLSNAGQVTTMTIVTFSVGNHGPFTLVYPIGTATPAQISQDITARVNALMETNRLIAALNASSTHPPA